MATRTPRRKRSTGKRRIPVVFVVSDGRGETCSQVVRAAALQFEGEQYEIVVHGKIWTAEAVEQIVRQARDRQAVVFYTLVADETRGALEMAAKEQLVPAVDVLGPAFSALHDLFRTKRRGEPGLLYMSDRDRFDVHAAIDYTLKHDDGQRPHELAAADVVLVGVSRASKSSTCFYLACEGVKAANVPLVPGVDPPRQLFDVDPNRVIALRVNVMRLMTVREARAGSLGLEPSNPYLDQRQIAREVNLSTRLVDGQGWRSIDASYMAIEEIARQVLDLCGVTRRGLRI